MVKPTNSNIRKAYWEEVRRIAEDKGISVTDARPFYSGAKITNDLLDEATKPKRAKSDKSKKQEAYWAKIHRYADHTGVSVQTARKKYHDGRYTQTGTKKPAKSKSISQGKLRKAITPTPTTKTTDHPQRIEIEMPEGGITLKMVNKQNRCQGTLILSSDGMLYVRPNGKPTDRRLISWKTLQTICETGLFE